MRAIMILTLALGLAASATAVDTGNKHIVPVKDGAGDGMADTREGGESYADALVIPGLPYEDSGATCDNTNDITPSCAYSYAPDVVYVFTPQADMVINVDLCGSAYDTVFEIQDAGGVPIACNDDYCGLQSGLLHVNLSAGNPYYFIIDGYGTDCGSYILSLPVCCGCHLECPDGSLTEGEPDCADEYVDTYNGGCNCNPPVFQPIWGAPDGTRVVCGRSGTYSYQGYSYRDTDWFEVYGWGVLMEAALIAEFPVQLLLIYGADCSYPQYLAASGGECEDIWLSREVEAGTRTWVWVGPSAFSGVSCASQYILELAGITPEVISPVGTGTWGEIKSCFR